VRVPFGSWSVEYSSIRGNLESRREFSLRRGVLCKRAHGKVVDQVGGQVTKGREGFGDIVRQLRRQPIQNGRRDRDVRESGRGRESGRRRESGGRMAQAILDPQARSLIKSRCKYRAFGGRASTRRPSLGGTTPFLRYGVSWSGISTVGGDRDEWKPLCRRVSLGGGGTAVGIERAKAARSVVSVGIVE
jgi:hypothetical protein